VSQAIRGATAHAPAAASRKGSKADLDGLRDRIRGLGFGHDEIAAEVPRRYRVRPADPGQRRQLGGRGSHTGHVLPAPRHDGRRGPWLSCC
jgi:hypothetical protein